MINDFKIALIALYDWNALGVRTLHSVLKSQEINSSSIFFKLSNPNNTMARTTDEEIDILIKLLKNIQPTLVGISLRSTMFKLSAKLTQRIKKELGVLTIWGGIHPTIEPEQSLEYADMVCIGEGEVALSELCKKLSNGLDYSDIATIWLKRNGKIKRNKLRPLIEDFDSLAYSDFTNENKYLIEHGKELELPSINDRAEYDIMTSRGCPFACTYCCNNKYRKIYQGLGRYVRRRNVKNVIGELMQACSVFKNLSYIYFYDDVFSFDRNWIAEFSRQYRAKIRLPFFCYTHPNFTDKNVIWLLKEAGLRDVTMGIQSGSKYIRDKFLKRFCSNDKILNSARIFKRYNLNVSYDILLDNPFEDNNTRSETLNLLLNLPRPFQLHTHSLTFFPKTELTELALTKRYITEKDIEDRKEQSYQRWTPTLDFRRDKENLFWDNLYYMAKKRYFPRKLIVKLSQNRLLKKYPKFLTVLLRMFTYDVQAASTGRFKIAYLVSNALKMIIRGEFSRFKSHLKMYLKKRF